MQDTPDWQAQYDALIEAGTAKSTRRAYSRDIRVTNVRFSHVAVIGEYLR